MSRPDGVTSPAGGELDFSERQKLVRDEIKLRVSRRGLVGFKRELAISTMWINWIRNNAFD